VKSMPYKNCHLKCLDDYPGSEKYSITEQNKNNFDQIILTSVCINVPLQP
jgi:hypothetical protein